MRAPDPLLLRGSVLLVVGLVLELAVPVALLVAGPFPAGSSAIPSNGTSSPASLGPIGAVEVAAIVIWNTIGVGVALLGISWLIQWHRNRLPPTPRRPLPPARPAPPAPPPMIAPRGPRRP